MFTHLLHDTTIARRDSNPSTRSLPRSSGAPPDSHSLSRRRRRVVGSRNVGGCSSKRMQRSATHAAGRGGAEADRHTCRASHLPISISVGVPTQKAHGQHHRCSTHLSATSCLAQVPRSPLRLLHPRGACPCPCLARPRWAFWLLCVRF